MDVAKAVKLVPWQAWVALIGVGGAMLWLSSSRDSKKNMAAGITSSAIDSLWGVTYGAVEGIADSETVSGFWDFIGDAGNTLDKAITGKDSVTLTSDVLYGGKLTPYGVAYIKWMKGGKQGPAPRQQDYPAEFSLWDRIFNQIN